MFDNIYNDDSQERPFEHHIYGYDIDMKAVNTARLNVRAAGLSSDISVEQQDFKDFKKPEEKAIMVTNPPYGERISTPNLLATYKMIGERLKHEFSGNDAWVLSYREECFDQIGLKPSIKIPVYNGSLECEFRKYSMFVGRMREFREEGGIVKTEEEKRQMAEKHRFKQNRDFKKRLDEQEENEEGDIRSFTFHSLERQREAAQRRRDARSEWRGDRGERNEGGFRKGRGNDESRTERMERRKRLFGTDHDFNDRDNEPRKRGFKGKDDRDSRGKDRGRDFKGRDFKKRDFNPKKRFDNEDDD